MDIDHNQLGPLLTRLFDQSDLMHIRADEITAPHDDQLRLYRLFGASPTAEAHRIFPACVTGGIAYSLLKLRGAEPMEEPAVHSVHAEHPHISIEAVRQDRL